MRPDYVTAKSKRQVLTGQVRDDRGKREQIILALTKDKKISFVLRSIPIVSSSDRIDYFSTLLYSTVMQHQRINIEWKPDLQKNHNLHKYGLLGVEIVTNKNVFREDVSMCICVLGDISLYLLLLFSMNDF